MFWSLALVLAGIVIGSVVLALVAGALLSVNRRVDAREVIDLALDVRSAPTAGGVALLRERLRPPA